VTRRIVAQGTFDLIHPGHIHYFSEAAAMGDELHVIVARRENVTHKERPVLPDRQRRDVVDALGGGRFRLRTVVKGDDGNPVVEGEAVVLVDGRDGGE